MTDAVNKTADFLATMPGTMQDCLVERTTFNRGNFPLGHIFAIHSSSNEFRLVNSTIGGETYPNLKLRPPVLASYLTFDGKTAFYLNDNADIVAMGEIVSMG